MSLSNRRCRLILIALAVGACGTEPDPVAQPAELEHLGSAIMNGYPDTEDSAVVLVLRWGWGGSAICSGSLIAPNVVLTAQHCVSPTQSPVEGVDCSLTTFGKTHPVGEMFVSTHSQITQNPAHYHGTSQILLPPGTGFCGRDIALIVLGEPISATEAEPLVVRVDSPLASGPPNTYAAGEEYSAIGYGNTGVSGSGVRRRRDGLHVTCEGAACYIAGGYATEWLGDAGVCQGDSGGPAVDTLMRVVGVASRGGQGCSYPIYGYTFGWASWLKEQVTAATQEAGVETPRWATGWPTHPDWNVSSGETCTNGLQCESYLCLDGYCTRPCNDHAPCEPGFYCAEVPGDGAPVDSNYCYLVPVGGACEEHADCDPAWCRDGICTRECGGIAPCPDGFVCNEEVSVCEVHPVGAPCASAEDCDSGLCHDDGYCTRACFGMCPTDYTCVSDRCVLRPLGDPCQTSSDCDSGQCDDGLCTHGCNDSSICQDEAWSCDAAAGYCTLIEVGGECVLDADCEGGALCQDALCTRACDDVTAPCPVLFECRSNGLCAALPPPTAELPVTCASGQTPGGGAIPAVLAVLLLLGAMRRSRLT